MATTAPRAIAVALALGVAGLGAWSVLGSNGCGGPSLPAPVDAPRGQTIPLVHAPFAELVVPAESRDGQAVPVALALDPGSWSAAGTNDKGGAVWRMANPFRPRGLFFMRAQPGMALTRADGSEVPYRLGARGTGPSWSHDRDELTLVLPSGGTPPPLNFRYPLATEREQGLNRDAAIAAGLVEDVEGFVRGATVQEGWTSRKGLLLPAPSRAAFDVTLPQAPVLSFAPGLVRPELGEASRSDGARLTVTVDDGSGPVEVYGAHLQSGAFPSVRLDLSRWAEKPVRLALETHPGATATFDYAFVGEPLIHGMAKNPRRVILVFVDTLRPDHLSTYGYERPTSPVLDAFAQDAVVFEQARSVAPWTLPSARTVVTGRHPEHWDTTPTLPGILGQHGFVTGMIAGNVYLSANFGMSRDWDLHDVGKFDGRGWESPPADEVTDQAIAWLDAHSGQDALLLVHYMSVHLPYAEPITERFRWASTTPPDGFPAQFSLNDVRRKGRTPAVRGYVADRYDQTIHWVDGELARLFAAVDDNDVLVFFSDHGEELWDHGGFEHGHTLYDELLRVPLVVKAPGLPAGRVQAPVSLLDVTPTVLDALGLPLPEMDGTSLLPVARGDAQAAERLGARPLAFGRPLYGARERWGVLDGSLKWTTTAGDEDLFELGADPLETRDLAGVRTSDLPRMRALLGTALGRPPAGVGVRLLPTGGTLKAGPLTARIHVPGGVGTVWAGDDPLQHTDVVIRAIDAETAEITWSGSGTREAFVLPTLPVDQVLHRLCVTASQRGQASTHAVPASVPALPTTGSRSLLDAGVPGGSLHVGWSFSPAPLDGHLALDATDSEMTEALEVIGYTEEEREPTPAGAPVTPGAGATPCTAP